MESLVALILIIQRPPLKLFQYLGAHIYLLHVSPEPKHTGSVGYFIGFGGT